MSGSSGTESTAGKSRTLNLEEEQGKSRDALIAEAALHPAMTGSSIAVEFSRGMFGEVSLMDAVATLKDKISAVQGGDLSEAEALLTAQAHALNSIFTDLSRRAALNVGRYPETVERYLRLALKAQGQCRTTLETLATIKNPPIVYAKQANIAQGPQQVNYGIPNTAPPSRARETEINQNELSGSAHELLPDAGTSTPAGGVSSQVEAVGKVQRAEVHRG